MLKSIERPEHDVLLRLIERWRVESDLSQRELSLRLGRSSNYLTKVESGTYGVEVVDFVDIIRALGRNVPASLEEYGRLLQC